MMFQNFPRNWYKLIITINCSIRIHVFQKQKWSNSMSLGKAYIFHQKLEIHCPYCNHSSLSEHSLLFCDSKLVHFIHWNIIQGVSFEIFWFQMTVALNWWGSDPKLVKPKCVWGAVVFSKYQMVFHPCKIYRTKMASICINLHGLMDKAVDCYAKGPQIESYSGDIRKIYFWRNLLFFKFFFEKITFSIKNCHLSNTFWLYQLRVRTSPIKCYSHLKSENFKWNTL